MNACVYRAFVNMTIDIALAIDVQVKTPVVQQARSKLQNAVWTRMPLAGSNA